MSFGLGISFGRLCKPRRTLEEVYLKAPEIRWSEPKESLFDTDPKIRAELMRCMGRTFDETLRKAILSGLITS